jgi:signal transduction histidine kinase
MIAVVALFQDVSERKRIQQQIIDVSGREQRRIAHDLHDGLGQELAAIIYRIKAAKSHLARAQRPEMRELETIGQLAETVLARMRDLVKVVQPVALDARGLMHGLRELARSASRLYDVDCSFTCPRPIAVKDQDMALHVFRIAQEAVHNAVKHGKPRRIAIGLVKRGHLVELSIMNDGADFEPAKSRRDKGLGLHIMTYRANVLHGDLSVTRHRPRGTLVRCVFNADRIL